MSTFAAPQQSDWNTNIYNLTITRILIVFGVTYLIRSIVSYFFQTVPAATRAPSTDGWDPCCLVTRRRRMTDTFAASGEHRP